MDTRYDAWFHAEKYIYIYIYFGLFTWYANDRWKMNKYSQNGHPYSKQTSWFLYSEGFYYRLHFPLQMVPNTINTNRLFN